MAQPFDARALRVHGEAVPLAADVPYAGATTYADFSVSATGTLAFRRREGLRTQLTWLDRAGHALGTIARRAPIRSRPSRRTAGASWSSERKRAETTGSGSSICSGTRPGRVVEPGPYSSPLWSRDGQSILFGTGFRGEPGELRRRAWDGTGSEDVLLKAEGTVRPGDVSPDGRVVAYMTATPQRGPDILVLPLAGEAKASSLIQTARSEGLPQFSPDGRWLAYTAFEGATGETYVEPNPPRGGRYQISVSGGTHPRWRPDGKEIFYLSPDGTLMAVDIDPLPQA